MSEIDRPSVLILTHERDYTADRVVVELSRRSVPVFRFHTSDFPQTAKLVARICHTDRPDWTGKITANGRSVSLERVRSVWYRRPRRFEFHPNLTDIEKEFALKESRFGIGGVLRSLNARWVNPIESEAAANYKPWQLAAATSCGLAVPKTLITNSPVEIPEFRARCPDGVIYKTLSGTARSSQHVASFYTSRLDDDELAGVDHSACLFQEIIPKQADLRVTIVGDAVFPVAIHNDRNALDWRKLDPGSLRYELHPLPCALEDSLKRLITVLGLEFAAIDLVLKSNDEYVFLEVNPNGEWGWLEQTTGTSICNAMADHLAAENPDTVALRLE